MTSGVHRGTQTSGGEDEVIIIIITITTSSVADMEVEEINLAPTGIMATGTIAIITTTTIG